MSESEATPTDPWALVVGGSGGLGAVICEHLARDGWNVIVGYRTNAATAEQVAQKVREVGAAAGVRAIALPDGDPGDWSGVGCLVFAAGADIEQPYLSQTDPDALRAAIETETLGFFNLVAAALPTLRAAQGNVVALVTAGLARWPVGDGLSVIPKAGVHALVRGLAREEGRFGVRANAVAVGVIEAGMFERMDFDARWIAAARENIPLKRFGTADEVAALVTFLASDRASYVSGQTWFADGGYSA